MSWFDEFKEGVVRDYGIGRDDRAKMFYDERERRGLDDDAQKFVNMTATHPVSTRVREVLGKATPEAAAARAAAGYGLLPTRAGQAGQIVGSIGADITQDASRSFWWLMNAAQASANVANEAVLANVNPDLYGSQKSDIAYKDINSLADINWAKKNQRGELERVPGISQRGGKAIKKNYRSGYVTALGIPTGVAINNALGLLTPFGGAEGYEAVMPSAEDPSKTSNVVGEVAAKYLLGRTGNLLDYDEFKKVRPDVSKGEYNAYKAFKYDKALDVNPFDDGKINPLPGSIIKATDDGIHGAELQFLGRSLPATTAGVPFLSALIGGALGVRRGKRYRQGGDKFGTPDPDAVKNGMIGGSIGAVGGIALGNLLEGERRRRNEASNQAYYDTL
jgi:hypothetical protein